MTLFNSAGQTFYESVRQLAAEHIPFNADDAAAISDMPDDTHQANGKNNGIGQAFRRAAAEGIIKPTGRIVRSKRKHRKGGMQQEWIGT